MSAGGPRLAMARLRPQAGLRQVLPQLRNARYEVLPTRSAEQAVIESVPSDVTVTVTASPTKGLEPTLALA